MNSRSIGLVVLLAISVLTGCVRVDTGTSAPTLGEQLVDLARAKDLGLLSDEEFSRLKRELLLSL